MNNSTVMDALGQVLGGTPARELEGQHLDFKEDPARAVKGSGNPTARRVEILIDAAICFANADGESHIVLGVNDRDAGTDALTGTAADAAELRTKIFHGTRPNLTVDITEIHIEGTRLLDVRIPQGLDLYSRTSGAARRRVGAACQPLTEQERSDVRFRRSNPDLTARASGVAVDGLHPESLAAAHRLLRARGHDSLPASDGELLRRLGVLDNEGHVLKAGVILFGQDPGIGAVARHIWRRNPGAEPSAIEYSGPLIRVISQVRDRIAAVSDPEISRVELPTGQEAPIPDFPAPAVDEVVSNAFVHRDWGSPLPVVIDHSPITLSVDSPGSLPLGVSSERLLTTRSMPRNPVLMRAMHALGLVEETSRGFDRMWASMLRTGRNGPDIQADDHHVEVSFSTSSVDTQFVLWLAQLVEAGLSPDDVDSVSSLIVLKHLETAPTLSERAAARILQVGPSECTAQLEWMSRAGLIEKSSSPSDVEWQLAPLARQALDDAGVPVPRRGAVEQWILTTVNDGRTLTNRDVVSATSASSREVTRVLRYLADTQRVQKDPEGPARGPGVRWRSALR